MLEKVILADKEYIVKNGLYFPVKKESTFEEMGGAYRLEEIDKGVEVLIPDMEIEPIDKSKLNRMGRARLKFLQEEKEENYYILLATGELMPHLLKIQEEAEEMREKMLPQMKKKWGLTEQLKIDNQMEWVGLMNNLEATMREMILNQLIYI
ncbi:TnpV protein [Fusobacterium animalis]|uniref:TnpV protein n=2 Tax=Fusobacterium animalis TaxID=76859 RepID=A0A2G9FGQ5_9FUSO|nr:MULTISPECIES: TnpV protein [Fusobacterium]PIM92337.1 TnpV protein [Fusobacterium animalis]PIM94585.1 TnpV protein [Fusobacterium animalis]